MSIGLYDADIANYINVPFNLELMKLSTYYKKKNEIVHLSPSFSPDHFSKFIYRKDYEGGDFPLNFWDFKNIDYGGLSFTNNKYIPLPEEIEKQKADTYLYEPIKKIFCKNVSMTKAFNSLNKYQHCRLSLDGKEIWSGFYNQLYRNTNILNLFFHDYDLNTIDGAYEFISELLRKYKKGNISGFLGTKFPIQINNAKDLLNWIKIPPSSIFLSMQYNGLMDDEVFVQFIESQKGATYSRQLDYIVTKNLKSENEFIINILPKIFKQVSFSRMAKKKIILKYDDDFFIDKRWEKVIQLFNSYCNVTVNAKADIFNKNINDDTMFKFVSSFKDKSFLPKDIFTKSEARELFLFVKENNYEVFKDFYECSTVKFKGGKLING